MHSASRCQLSTILFLELLYRCCVRASLQAFDKPLHKWLRCCLHSVPRAAPGRQCPAAAWAGGRPSALLRRSAKWTAQLQRMAPSSMVVSLTLRLRWVGKHSCLKQVMGGAAHMCGALGVLHKPQLNLSHTRGGASDLWTRATESRLCPSASPVAVARGGRLWQAHARRAGGFDLCSGGCGSPHVQR